MGGWGVVGIRAGKDVCAWAIARRRVVGWVRMTHEMTRRAVVR